MKYLEMNKKGNQDTRQDMKAEIHARNVSQAKNMTRVEHGQQKDSSEKQKWRCQINNIENA